jgi:hypothetical protein
VKNLDLIDFNSGNTLDKSLNNTYNLFTAYKNDTILIDYGDSTQQTLQINSSKFFYIIFIENQNITF